MGYCFGIDGTFMAKSLLILAVLTTQLLGGSSGSVYLCISRDGSFRIDTGPVSCVCSHYEEEHHPHFDRCCSKSTKPCGDQPGALAAVGEVKPALPDLHGPSLLAGGDCVCTHIPLLIEQSPAVTRVCATRDVERLAPLVVFPQVTVADQKLVAVSSAVTGWRVRVAARPTALTVVSTVVFRC